MVLVDTSVWVFHLRRHDQRLDDLLGVESIFCHPFIIGEIACGQLKNRTLVLDLLKELPQVITISNDEALEFIDKHKLFGLGIGYIDIHLLASCVMSNVSIWTEDRPLQKAAQHLNISYKPF